MVRTVRLAHAAVCAEGLRLRHAAQRMVLRAVLVMIALGFLALGVGFAHLAVWLALQPRYGAGPVALGLTLSDLAIAGGLMLLAARLRPGRVESEARAVSAQAWRGMRQSMDLWALMLTLARIFAARRRADPR